MNFLLVIIITIFYSNCSIKSLSKWYFSPSNPTTYIFGHKNPDTDAILSAIIMANFEKETGNENEVIACRLGDINKETEYVLNYFDVQSPSLISKAAEADEVILVDHNEPSQSADDIEKANVVKVIDHHGLTGFRSDEPIYIITKPVGCTATILYKLYNIYDVKLTKTIAGLMLSAIISDTILLKSPITTNEDIQVVKKLSEFIEIDYEDFGYKMLLKGTDVSDYTAEKIINMDLKNYNVNGYNIDIAFLNSVNIKDTILQRKDELLVEINRYILKHKSRLFVFVILDIINMDSTALVEGELSFVVEEAFDVTLNDHEAFLPGISSRKSQVYPYISRVIEKLQPYSYSSKISINIFLFLVIISMIL